MAGQAGPKPIHRALFALPDSLPGTAALLSDRLERHPFDFGADSRADQTEALFENGAVATVDELLDERSNGRERVDPLLQIFGLIEKGADVAQGNLPQGADVQEIRTRNLSEFPDGADTGARKAIGGTRGEAGGRNGPLVDLRTFDGRQ